MKGMHDTPSMLGVKGASGRMPPLVRLFVLLAQTVIVLAMFARIGTAAPLLLKDRAVDGFEYGPASPTTNLVGFSQHMESRSDAVDHRLPTVRITWHGAIDAPGKYRLRALANDLVIKKRGQIGVSRGLVAEESYLNIYGCGMEQPINYRWRTNHRDQVSSINIDIPIAIDVTLECRNTRPVEMYVGFHASSPTPTNVPDYMKPYWTVSLEQFGVFPAVDGNSVFVIEPYISNVVCRVFDDGYSKQSPSSDAVYVRGSSKVCVPDGTPQGLCRKWFGRCETVGDKLRQPVVFQVFDDGGANGTGPADAVYLRAPQTACVPDGTPAGSCRRWFGKAVSQDKRSVECFLFDDGYRDMTGPTTAIYFRSDGRVCLPDGTSNGTCRKWFGRCRAR